MVPLPPVKIVPRGADKHIQEAVGIHIASRGQRYSDTVIPKMGPDNLYGAAALEIVSQLPFTPHQRDGRHERDPGGPQEQSSNASACNPKHESLKHHRQSLILPLHRQKVQLAITPDWIQVLLFTADTDAIAAR